MTTEFSLDVRYSECDQGGVVHHSVYAIWYETARMDFFRKIGFPFTEMNALDILPPLVDLHVQYHAPVRYPARVSIKTFIGEYSPKKIELRYQLYSGGVLASEATTLIVWTNKTTMRSMDLEAAYPEIYAKIAAAAQA